MRWNFSRDDLDGAFARNSAQSGGMKSDRVQCLGSSGKPTKNPQNSAKMADFRGFLSSIAPAGLEPARLSTMDFESIVPDAQPSAEPATYTSAANSLPRSLPQNTLKDDDLQRVIDAWPTLPKDVRKMIAGVVSMTRKRR